MAPIALKSIALIVLAGLLGRAAPEPAPDALCDGEPPKLTNKDQRSHDYEIKCASKTEQATIPAGATQKLEGKSGCTIKLGDGGPTKLYTEMVCTIADGKLSCDLL